MFTVFSLINHTYSSIGSEALYKRLRSFDLNDSDQLKTENIIKYYDENPTQREKIQFVFAQLGKQDNNSVVKQLTEDNKKQFFHFGLYLLLGSLPIIGVLLLFTQLAQYGVMIAISSLVFNLLYSQINKMSIGNELLSMSYLVQSISSAKQLSKINHPLKEELKVNLRPLKRIPFFSFAFRMGGSNEGEILFDYLNMFFMLPFISYHFVYNRIKKNKEEALKLWEVLGNLESAAAILNLRLILEEGCIPQFTNQDEVVAENVTHPLIDNPVDNPVHWTQNTLVSGSNASGKSTYVKSVAINCILAQTMFTCTASSFSMKRGHVLTSMAVEDDIIEGDSYFIAEIKSLKRILSKVKAGDRCYCFIDEILKGTNTIERISASASIIKWLSESPSLAFIATHDIELTEILKTVCENVHFQENVTNEQGIDFDYTLRKGSASTRNALKLLDIMEFPESVVAEAKEKAAYFDQNQMWENI
ncbi:DNA mismatch repair protein MutS [Alkalibacterium iburiense]|uniref:DNA mismatch repair protein MutS n=2 Tax=Alkalibacterium iburiense TaxID=290589 RepID=A0ABP3H7R6_9LACT